jgi:hypothetical protein
VNQAPTRPTPGTEGKRGRRSNRFDSQINVEQRPVQMVRGLALNDRNLFDTGVAKPWKVLERQKQFLVTDQQPQAVPGHVGGFNRESACSRHR